MASEDAKYIYETVHESDVLESQGWKMRLRQMGSLRTNREIQVQTSGRRRLSVSLL